MIVKSVGLAHFGSELYKWDPNGHNGMVKGTEYFKVANGYGFFVSLLDVIDIHPHICLEMFDSWERLLREC